MELLLATVLGLVTGSGAARTHRLVDGGPWLNLVAGALGGLMGGPMLGDAFAPSLADSALAGAAVGGAVGGIVLAVAAGIARQLIWPRRRP